MKIFPGLLITILVWVKGLAQTAVPRQNMVSLYMDNDFINILGDGTDKGFTGAFRLGYYYNKTQTPRFFLSKLLPSAGKNAINTYGWSLMQVAFTPNDIKTVPPAVNDYPYSGGLFVTHSLRSYNGKKKYGLETGVLAGIMGKYSFAGETQKGIHKIIDYQQPRGWHYQMPTDLLLNLNVAGEKMLLERKWVEMLAGARLSLGTMQNGAGLYGHLRLGKMNPYSQGYIAQYASAKGVRNSWQLYLDVRPGLEWVGYYALLDGGVFKGRSDYYRPGHNEIQPYETNKKLAPVIEASLIGTIKKFSLSFTQKIMRPTLKDFAPQAIGNFTLSWSW